MDNFLFLAAFAYTEKCFSYIWLLSDGIMQEIGFFVLLLNIKKKFFGFEIMNIDGKQRRKEYFLCKYFLIAYFLVV